MALPITRWGTQRYSGGFLAALKKQIRALDYGAASKITVSFDPFGTEGVGDTRLVLGYMSAPKIRATNFNCNLKANVLCDRAAPTINAVLTDGSEVELRTANLSQLEILTLFNETVSSKAPKKVEQVVVQTKAEKSSAGGGRGGRKR